MDLMQTRWEQVQAMVQKQFNKEKLPDLDAILMLIGINELGKVKAAYTKEEKQDLMHVAICHLLSQEGYYVFEGRDVDGWPHWVPVRSLPKLTTKEQETLLKTRIIEYFGL